MPKFTPEEVSRHRQPNDCWVSVDGKVYDVTSWVPRHPGGDLIFVQAGKDCTHLFNSYHPYSARKTLEKFYVGDLVDTAETDLYEDDGTGEKFYAVVKDRVAKYFRDNKINPRVSIEMYVKTAVIFATLVICYYGAFFLKSSLGVSLLFAVGLGVAFAEVGVSIQHDANHGAYSTSPAVNHFMGLALDLVGASSFMWKQQHVVGHHAYTNLDGMDPDIRVTDKDVRRVTQHQPWHSYQRYQHLYLALLYGLLSLKSVLVDDFAALSEGRIGPVAISKLTARESAEFWLGKSVFFAGYVAAPLAFSPHSAARLLLVWIISQFVIGWLLAFMFQVAHVTPDVAFLRGGSGAAKRGWGESQVATTADFCHGSWLWTHFSGGLNYQVVHHLFPGVCHMHYPKIAPIVLETCREFGVPYVVYPTFGKALMAHFRHLAEVGAGHSIPSLATVG